MLAVSPIVSLQQEERSLLAVLATLLPKEGIRNTRYGLGGCDQQVMNKLVVACSACSVQQTPCFL